MSDVDTTDSGDEPRPHVFQTGTVEEPPPPSTNDDIERPQVFRQGERRTVAGSVAVDDDPLA